MLHLVSFMGFLTVAVSTAALIWTLIAERSDAIVAALRMTEPAPSLPMTNGRTRVRPVATVRVTATPAQRRAA